MLQTSQNITVNEQLFPTKTKHKFTQYMVKSDKFCIKFCIKCKKTKPRHEGISENVVLCPVEFFLGKGRNATGKLFSSLHISSL